MTYRIGISPNLHTSELKPVPVGVQLRGPMGKRREYAVRPSVCQVPNPGTTGQKDVSFIAGIMRTDTLAQSQCHNSESVTLCMKMVTSAAVSIAPLQLFRKKSSKSGVWKYLHSKQIIRD